MIGIQFFRYDSILPKSTILKYCVDFDGGRKLHITYHHHVRREVKTVVAECDGTCVTNFDEPETLVEIEKYIVAHPVAEVLSRM